jgi:hypothetical protein
MISASEADIALFWMGFKRSPVRIRPPRPLILYVKHPVRAGVFYASAITIANILQRRSAFSSERYIPMLKRTASSMAGIAWL